MTWGGGIFVSGALDGQLAVRASTISGNAAAGGAGISFGDFNPDSLVVAVGGSASLENSTVASNNAAVIGGGLYLSAYSGGGGPHVDLPRPSSATTWPRAPARTSTAPAWPPAARCRRR